MSLVERKVVNVLAATYSRSPRSPANIIFRFIMLLLAMSLCLQSGWLLLSESRPGITELPTDSASAISAARRRNSSIWAARIGVFWRRSLGRIRFYISLICCGIRQRRQSHPRAGIAAGSHKSLSCPFAGTRNVWCMATSFRLGHAVSKFCSGRNGRSKKSLSYYTGPTDVHLMPLRLRIAAQTDAFNDIEVRQFVTRDLRIFLAQHQEPAIAEAFTVGHPRRPENILSNKPLVKSIPLPSASSGCSVQQ